MTRTILVPVDGSDKDARALAVAADLAQLTDASLLIVRVRQPQTESALRSRRAPCCEPCARCSPFRRLGSRAVHSRRAEAVRPRSLVNANVLRFLGSRRPHRPDTGGFVSTLTAGIQSLRQDIYWSLRSLRKRPTIAVVVILSIGLAIGATTASFSVVNAFMLRSWNADGMDRVVRVREDFARPGEAPDVRGFTLANLGAWRRENTVFEGLAAGMGSSATLVEDGRAERVAAGVVTANFFSVLGFRPILGRTFTDEEDTPERRDAVVLGYGLWQSRFGGDTGVIGRTISLNGRTRTVVGVM